MTIYYEEFDTTAGGLRAALATKIAAHADWDNITPTQSTTTTTAATATNTTSWTVASSASFYPGQGVKITVGGVDYYRHITAITSGTNITINAQLGVTTAIGQVITSDQTLLKTTTTRGAQMVIDLTAGGRYNDRLGYRLFRTHTGADATSASWTDITALRTVFWAQTQLTNAAILHVVLSVSAEHLYISIEGPRANEGETQSVIYGSLRNYMFISDVIPYHAADTTPCVAGWGVLGEDSAPAIADQLWRTEVSRNAGNTSSWKWARLATLTLPHFASGVATSPPNYCAIDGKTYLWPYVVIEEDDGLRGRLALFHFVGITTTSYGIDTAARVGELITYDGVVYKTLALHKGDTTNVAGGGLGYYSGIAASSHLSIVAAIPYADAP